MPRAAKPVFSETPAASVGRSRLAPAAIGEHGLRRARVVGTHRANGATAAINPGRSRSPLDAVSGWKLGLVTDFARLINSEFALLCRRQGAATHADLLVGSGGTLEEIARPL
jgi:hypothetical protein